MATDATLRAIITVLDQTAAPLHAISQRFEHLTSPLAHLGSRLSEIGEATGLAKLGEHAAQSFERVKKLGEGIAELAAPLAALGGVASVAGLVEMAKSTAEFGEKLKLGAIITGMSTEALSGWHYAAQLANVDAEQLDHGLQFLNRSIAEAAMGKSKDVEAIFSRMGLQNTQGHLVGTAQALRAIASEAKHLVDSGQVQLADDMMAKLFGARRGAELLPLFSQGPEAIGKILEEAKAHGISFTNEQVEGSAQFMDAWKNMAASVDGVRYAIGNELFPILTPIIKKTTEWMDANRPLISSTIRDAVVRLGHDIKVTGEWVGWVIDMVGGVEPALGIAAIAFTGLGRSAALAAVKFGLFPVAALVYDFALLIPTIGGAADAFAAFDLVIAANPVGAAIIAVVALGAAAYELYEHWDAVSTWFSKMWNGLPGPVKTAIEDILAVTAPLIAVPVLIYQHWEDIVRVFHELGAAIDSVHLPDWMTSLVTPDAADAHDERMRTRFRPRAIDGTPLTSLPGSGGGAPSERSETAVRIDMTGVPKDAKVSVDTKGDPDLRLNVGHAMNY
jgi:hypothetical protein